MSLPLLSELSTDGNNRKSDIVFGESFFVQTTIGATGRRQGISATEEPLRLLLLLLLKGGMLVAVSFISATFRARADSWAPTLPLLTCKLLAEPLLCKSVESLLSLLRLKTTFKTISKTEVMKAILYMYVYVPLDTIAGTGASSGLESAEESR